MKTYRHFSPGHGVQKEPSPRIEDTEHEQIVPQTETNLNPAAKDSSNITYYYNVDANNDGGFQIFKNFLNKDNLRWYQDGTDSYWSGYYDLQEQEMPLDLTVQK